ncbi:MAG: hypothetical protein R3236_10830, partial [Phycisphaeraceae bacterium]|nr:hypothetical protein [Phycisphaeraceae bacterium]
MFLQRLGVDTEVLEQPLIADGHPATAHLARHTLAGHGIEVFRTAERYAALFRAGHDGRRQRMLAVLFEAGAELQELLVTQPRVVGNADQLRLALGERAGLVHH